MLLSQLTDDQKGHLAYRLDHNTCCGFGTASRVARGDHGDMEVVEIFQKYGDRSKRSAQALAKKVEKFSVPANDKIVLKLSTSYFLPVLTMITDACCAHQLDSSDYAKVMDSIADGLKSSARLYRVLK